MSSTRPRTYRVYCFDAGKKVLRAEWLNASNDKEAIAEAEGADFGSQGEIWQGSRLVAKLGLQNQAAAVG